MDFGFYRNQYSKYKTYVMMFNFVVLAGICFVGLFTIIHGINIFVILGVLVVLFVVHKYLSSKHKAFSSVVNIFDKTNQLKLLINERKELVCEIGVAYNIITSEFEIMHSKYISNIVSYIKGYNLVDEENVRNYMNQLFKYAVISKEDNIKLTEIEQKITTVIGEYLYSVEFFLKNRKQLMINGCNFIVFDDSDKLVFKVIKKVYPVVRC